MHRGSIVIEARVRGTALEKTGSRGAGGATCPASGVEGRRSSLRSRVKAAVAVGSLDSVISTVLEHGWLARVLQSKRI
jgi:hypothetical protein